MARYSRARWGARAARGGPGKLDRSEVVGMCLHWPAIIRPLRGVATVSSALRAWQKYHMETHGWSDIAYQEAIDQDGNVYVLRGLWRQSGANGDAASNRAYGSILLVLAPGETPTKAMLKTLRRRIRRHRLIYRRSTKVVGHNQVRPEPTACPGPIVSGLINRGVIK